MNPYVINNRVLKYNLQNCKNTKNKIMDND